MKIEYEATFTEIDKDKVREKLRSVGAILVKKEFFQKRVTMSLPSGHEINGGWLRVRDEGDKITLTLKVIDGDKIENQKEICLEVDSLEKAEELLSSLGCKKKSYQENKREIWKLDETEIVLDEWPFLEPYVEIEGKSEKEVKEVSEKIGFDYDEALFCHVGVIYANKYGFSEDHFNNEIKEITFKGPNPFLNYETKN